MSSYDVSVMLPPQQHDPYSLVQNVDQHTLANLYFFHTELKVYMLVLNKCIFYVNAIIYSNEITSLMIFFV